MRPDATAYGSDLVQLKFLTFEAKLTKVQVDGTNVQLHAPF